MFVWKSTYKNLEYKYNQLAIRSNKRLKTLKDYINDNKKLKLKLEETLNTLKQVKKDQYNSEYHHSQEVEELKNQIRVLKLENEKLGAEDELATKLLSDFEKYGVLRDKKTNRFTKTKDWIQKYYG